MSRPSWTHYFLGIAAEVAKRSTCDRANVGAIICRKFQILTTGYNGAPRGMPHCSITNHALIDNHCTTAIHAEANAVIQAAREGIKIEGAELYVTHRPCERCAAMLVNAGITEVYYSIDKPSIVAGPIHLHHVKHEYESPEYYDTRPT